MDHGVASFYGGSTQVHLGPGPHVDPIQPSSLLAALISGERLDLTDPGESEDIGRDWNDPRALPDFGDREATEPWAWAGPARPSRDGRGAAASRSSTGSPLLRFLADPGARRRGAAAGVL